MKVKATQLGYYGHQRRKEGDTFQITDEKAFSKVWMEKVEKMPEQKSKKAVSKKEVNSSTDVI